MCMQRNLYCTYAVHCSLRHNKLIRDINNILYKFTKMIYAYIINCMYIHIYTLNNKNCERCLNIYTYRYIYIYIMLLGNNYNLN